MKSRKTPAVTDYIRIAVRGLFVLLIIGAALAILYASVRFALPFLIACALSLFLNPLVSVLEKKAGLPRGLASFLVLFVLFSVSISLLLLLAMALLKGVVSLTKTVPGQLDSLIGDLQTLFFTKLVPSWEKAVHIFSGLNHGQKQAIQLNIESMAGTLIDLLNDLAVRLVTSLTQFISSLPDTLISSIFIFFATFFLSRDSEIIKRHLSSLPSGFRRPAVQVWQELKKTLIGFVRAQFILVTLTMILVYIGLLVLKSGHPFTIAFIAGLVDLIPYLGIGVIFIPWITYQLMLQHYSFALALAALYVTAMIQRQLMEPKILSSSIGLDPFASLLALYFGFRWLGFSGLIIGPLLLVAIKALHHAGVWHKAWLFTIGKNS